MWWFTTMRTKTWSLGSNRKLTTADPPGTRSSSKSAKRTPRKIKSSFFFFRQAGFGGGSLGHDWNISTIIQWIAMKFCAQVHGPRKILYIDFNDPLTFPLAPP